MPYIVEVCRIPADLAHSMAEMRIWLDRHQIDPTIFDHWSAGGEITFRVGFHSEGNVLAFAQGFHGRFNDGSDPDGRAFWPITDPPP